MLDNTNTHHEGLQSAIDIMFDREMALSQMFRDAVERRDNQQMTELGVRLEEIAGLIRAVRGYQS